MLNLLKIEGAIFDFDDTLLDTQTKRPQGGLHEESRMAAVIRIGFRDEITSLQTITAEENKNAFRDSLVHTVDGAVWRILYSKGVVLEEIIDHNNQLLIDIVNLKELLHEDILRNNCLEVPGAIKFINKLVDRGFQDRLAIASMSGPRDINIFFKETGLDNVFPENRIVHKQKVKKPKPDPEVFEAAFLTLGLPESSRINVFAFEDDPKGVVSASEAGLTTCAITTRFSRDYFLNQNPAPDFIADSYQEFSELFGLA